MSAARDPHGCVAVITGAAGAIGTEIAFLLERAGAHLTLVDLDLPRLELLQAQLRRPAQLIAADLTNADDIRRVRQDVIAHHGTCHLLVNNAGIVKVEAFEETTADSVEQELRINLLAPALLSREFFPWLCLGSWQGDRWQKGQIVNIVSMAGIMPIAESAVYTASKYGLRGLMLALHQRFEPRGVHVSSILPGAVDTGMLRHEATHGGSPLNFLSEPQTPRQIAQAVMKTVRHPRVERYVPMSDGVSSLLVMLFPGLLARLVPFMSGIGERGRKRYLHQRGLQAVQQAQARPAARAAPERPATTRTA